jgi:hypothetical protein
MIYTIFFLLVFGPFFVKDEIELFAPIAQPNSKDGSNRAISEYTKIFNLKDDCHLLLISASKNST